MGIARRATRLGVLVGAVVSGLMAAYATMRLTGERTIPRDLPARYTVAEMEDRPGGVTVVLEDGRRIRVDTAGDVWNALHLPLVYPGKTVTLTPNPAGEANGRCTMLVPLLQADRPVLEQAEYDRLRAAGLGERDLAVSFRLPDGRPPLAGGGSRAGPPPGLCVAPTRDGGEGGTSPWNGM